MLQATMTRDAGMAPAEPTPPPPSNGNMILYQQAFTKMPAPTTPAPSKSTPFVEGRLVKQVLTLPYTCTNNVCTATGQLGFTFQTLQSLINMANKKLGNAAIAVDGKIDARTLAAYLPISRAVGGVLAIFDFTPMPDYLAKNADAFARAIALWLAMTWVEATPDVPGHWERLRAGQTTANLPTMPVAQPQQPVMEVKPTQPQTEQPKQPAPTTMVMYVCPDGTRVSDLSACPKPAPQPVVLPPQPTPVQPVITLPPPTSPAVMPPEYQAITNLPGTAPTVGRFQGCIARFNRTRKVFSIYCPVGSAASMPGLGTIDQEYFRCLRGNCTGLGADEVTPAVPAGFVKAAEVTTLPRAGETQAGEERDRFFRLGNPLMWAAIAGAATVVGGGSYMLYRRKRSV